MTTVPGGLHPPARLQTVHRSAAALAVPPGVPQNHRRAPGPEEILHRLRKDLGGKSRVVHQQLNETSIGKLQQSLTSRRVQLLRRKLDR